MGKCHACQKEFSRDFLFLSNGVLWCNGCISHIRVAEQDYLPKSILTEADALVNGDRQKAYADPITNFKRISAIASGLLGKEITPAECAMVLVATKLGREMHGHKRDNIIDCAGYLEIYNRIVEEGK